MTFKEFSKIVLQHIDQYSVAGVTIPSSYNNQADSISRICALANTAIRTIVTQAAPMFGFVDPNAPEFKGRTDLGNGMTKIVMPTDFYEMSGGGNPTFTDDCGFARNIHYMRISDNVLLIPTSEVPRLLISYQRYPRKLLGQDSEILDCSEAAADCASFYVAAQLARQDNPYLYQSLYNEYEQMLARLRPPVVTELSQVEDVYGF